MTDDLRAMRKHYEAGPLDEGSLAPTWLEQLRLWLGEAIEAGVPEPNAMVLATAAASGVPGGRTVLLKGLDDRGLAFFSNHRSRKGVELAENPRATCVFPWIALSRQVVVDGRVEHLPASESDAYFDSRPLGSRLGAAASPQSQVVASREELDSLLEELERQSPPKRPPWWGGYLVVPSAVEFWQGRANRLHDRFRYRQADGGWVVERLAP
jgi:pyridoxamine 5'-phosphate oxidase